ncbi:MAG: hypothetical protein ACR2KZ_17970, partial [Segetibacter sp.]
DTASLKPIVVFHFSAPSLIAVKPLPFASTTHFFRYGTSCHNSKTTVLYFTGNCIQSVASNSITRRKK